MIELVIKIPTPRGSMRYDRASSTSRATVLRFVEVIDYCIPSAQAEVIERSAAQLIPTKSMPPKKNAVASRIKRLMQADDDVGKIAQATPVLMGTCLCFVFFFF